MTNEQEKARELAKLLNAFADGKQLQCSLTNTYDSAIWDDDLESLLSDIQSGWKFRIKPETKRVVRLTKKDLFERLRKRQTLKIEIDDVIINYSNITDQINALIGTPKNYMLKWLCEIRAKFADGTPCYKEVEDE